MRKNHMLRRILPAFRVGIILILLFFSISNVVVVTASYSANSTIQNNSDYAGTSPSVQTQAASEITNNSAKLSGNLESLGTATSVDVSFEYGSSTFYGNETTTQTLTSTGPFSFNLANLSPGVTYHYRAKANGGIDGIAYGADATFTTGVPPTVKTLTATYVTSSTVTLNGSLYAMGSSTSVNLYFVYGTTTDYGSNTSSVTLAAPGNFSINVSGLSPGTTYHFQARADGGLNGISSGSDATFFSSPDYPSVSSMAANSITSTSVTMRANLLYMGTASSVKVYFQYGTTTSYGSTSGTQTMTSIGPYSVNVSGLQPDTTYHYRAVADAGQFGISTGNDEVFTTIAGQPPELGLAFARNVTATSADLVGNLTTKGTASSLNVYFEYGTTTDYGNTITATTPAGTGYYGGFTVTLTGLQQGTTYHFRAVADGGVYGTAYTEDMTFVTLGTGPAIVPAVTTGAANSITADSAVINGNLTTLGNVNTVYIYFQYGTSTSYGTNTVMQQVQATGSFTAELTGLKPGTLYHYRTVVDDHVSFISYGEDKTFSTSTLPPQVKTLAAENITDTSVTLSGSLDSLGTAASVKVYFEYGTTTDYGVTAGLQTVTKPGTFTVDLPSLRPDTQYHYRIQADGGVNGLTSGSDVSFTTLTPAAISVESNSLSITPATVSAGQNISVSVTVSNSSLVTGIYKVSLLVDGNTEDSQSVSVPAGSSQQVSFTITDESVGVHQVSVNGVSGSFTVTGNSTTITTENVTSPVISAVTNSGGINQSLFIVIIIVVVVLVILAILAIRFFENKKP